MTHIGTVQNGVMVLPPEVKLPEGTPRGLGEVLSEEGRLAGKPDARPPTYNPRGSEGVGSFAAGD